MKRSCLLTKNTPFVNMKGVFLVRQEGIGCADNCL